MADTEQKKTEEEKSKPKSGGSIVPAVAAFAVVALIQFASLKSMAGLSLEMKDGITAFYILPTAMMAAASGVSGVMTGTVISAVLMLVVSVAGKPAGWSFGQVFKVVQYIHIASIFSSGFIIAMFMGSRKKSLDTTLEDKEVEIKKLQAQYNKAKLFEDELKKESQRIQKLSSRIVAIQTLTQVIGKSLDEMKVLKEILDVSRKVFNAEQMAIFVLDQRTRTLSVKIQFGLKDAEAKAIKVKVGEGIIGHVAQTGDQITSNEIKKDYKLSDLSKRSNIPSVMCAPLSSGDNVVGVVNVMKLEGDRQPGQEDCRMLSLLAILAAMSMDNARLHQETLRLANCDGMTGLYNNRYFQGWLEREMGNADRINGKLSMYMTDIDHFKPFNDTYGHQIGDFVLEQTAHVIRDNIRDGDLAARYGGEEFVVVMPGADTQEAYKSAEKIRQAVASKTYQHGELSLRVTMSFGVATYPTHSRDKTELIKLADEGLYFAKEGGRNCTRIAFEEKQKAASAASTAGAPTGPMKTPIPEVGSTPPPAAAAKKRTRKFIKKIIKTKDGQIKQIVKVPVDDNGKPIGPPIPMSVKPSSGDEVIN